MKKVLRLRCWTSHSPYYPKNSIPSLDLSNYHFLQGMSKWPLDYSNKAASMLFLICSDISFFLLFVPKIQKYCSCCGRSGYYCSLVAN